LQERHINLTLEEGVAHYLAKEGYEPAFGARPLKRLIQHEVVTLLSKALLEGKISSNSDVKLGMEGERIAIKSA
jgi:ATP-dependent Clp protease ATP-binding subunit ClpB